MDLWIVQRICREKRSRDKGSRVLVTWANWGCRRRWGGATDFTTVPNEIELPVGITDNPESPSSIPASLGPNSANPGSPVLENNKDKAFVGQLWCSVPSVCFVLGTGDKQFGICGAVGVLLPRASDLWNDFHLPSLNVWASLTGRFLVRHLKLWRSEN